MLQARAPAKLNLTIEVLGRRRDGFHEVRTVMVSIDLCDDLLFQPGSGVTFFCHQTSLLSAGNSVVRAVQLLRQQTTRDCGAVIQLEKRIPVSGGLGGGSSDGAATLRGLNTLWGLDLPGEKLQDLARELGADAPFFLTGGTAALGEGRGDILTSLPPPSMGPIVLLVPPLTGKPGKTRAMYDLLDHHLYTEAAFTRGLAEKLSRGQPVSPSMLYNVFEEVADRFFPGLEEYRQALKDAGAARVHLAGSGPTLFAIASDEAHAAHIDDNLRRRKLASRVVHAWPG